MWWPTVLLLLLIIDRASAMCFEEQQHLLSQVKRSVIGPSQIVASHEECKEKCWNLETCLAYAYRDTSCVLLGIIVNKDSICSVKNKNEIVAVKCIETTSTTGPSPTPIGPGAGMSEKTSSSSPSPTPMGPGAGMPMLPECFRRESPSDNPFLPISECENIPAHYGIVCKDDQCYCEDTNKQLVVVDSSNNVVSAVVVLVCRKGPRWEVISPSTKAFVYAATVHVGSPACTYIAPPTYEQCMCDMPSIYWGRRIGDNLCGAGKIDYWEDYDKIKHTTELVCTVEGWTADGVPVKPDTVNCKYSSQSFSEHMMPQTAHKVLGRKRTPDRPAPRKLDAEERSILSILREKLEDDCITDDERTALAILAAIDKMDDAPCEDPNKGLQLRRVKDLPTEPGDDSSTADMFDLDSDGNVVARVIGGQSANGDYDKPRKTAKKVGAKKLKKDEQNHSFSLLAPPRNRLKTAADCGDALNYENAFEDRLIPPVPPRHPPLSKERVGYAQTPVFEITSKEEATSVALQKFAETSPFALFRNLASVMGMDLSVFHLEPFYRDHGDHPLEIREQFKLSPDENTDRFGKTTWECDSEKSDSTVIKYFTGAWDENFQEAIQRILGNTSEIETDDTPSPKKITRERRLSNEYQLPHLKKIKFGTNLDLSNPPHNPKLFKEQHDQLAKLPPFCRIKDDADLLSLIDHDILGMNTAQCYIKVPANRTPAHIENNAVASVNINIGPGDCEWFGVDYKYYGVVEKLLRKQGIDFLSGSWWPNAEQLLEMGVPVFRFTQREGELVWVGQGCIHWVQALGYCNNVAWNLIPNTHAQLSLAAHQYEMNKLKGYQSVVPLQNLFWDIAKKQRVTDEKIHCLVKGMLIRSLANVRMIAQWAEEKKGWSITEREREKGEAVYYCMNCQVEIFNIFFCKEEKQNEEGSRLANMVKEEIVDDEEETEEMDEDDGKVYAVYCYDCTRSSGCKKFYAMQEAPLSELEAILANFKLHIESKHSSPVEPKPCDANNNCSQSE